MYLVKHFKYICSIFLNMKASFQERLKELREERNLSQAQLSNALENKISASAIGKWELGERTPNLDAVILLAEFFGVSIDYLAGREN